jgi:hypothetical protein
MRLLSRRDEMMVARYEMPGKQAGTIRPVGNGMIRRFGPHPSPKTKERPAQVDHTVPYGTGLSTARFQAFHAWLPSFGPSGTCPAGHDGHAAERQASNTPVRPYTARRNSRTRTTTRTSTKRQTPSAEPQTPSAKRQTPNAYAP